MLGSLRTALVRATDRAAIRMTGGVRRPGEPPIVRARLPFLGHALAMGRDLTALLRACQRQHGDVFTLLVAGQRMHFVLDPLSFPLVLKAQDNLTFHEIGQEIGTRAFGYTSPPPGRDYDELESYYGEHLKNAALGPLTARMEERLRIAFDRFTGDDWREEGLFDFSARVIFAAGMETLYGEGIADDAAVRDFQRIDKWFPLLAAGAPAAAFPGLLRARGRLLVRVDRMRPDASPFIRARDLLLGKITTPRNRRHLQAAMVWASQANTLPAAFWALAHLLTDPPGRAAVVAEVEQRGFSDLKRLPQLFSSICETLRLCSESLTIRLVHRDCELTLADGSSITLRAGDRVALCPQVAHRDPEIFADPERFQFDRFLSDTGGPRQFLKGGQRVPIPLMPYGGGVSMCPGRFLANNEVMQFAGLALTQLDIELLEQELPPVDKTRAGLGVLSPTRDVRCRIRRRPRA
ncbi:cytochrome P450 [Nannocystis bainbridge]|uniref:Cytochrome P450 n=1 Tax=Nannocystis bainbridge TaxID=2995303 RepID=A0ABT5E9C9_9BACT|nr:cytochrome P450 [Nannocystis bainbridge]MDC0722030.1 cytochrome P450 [Nannocystis bainbridge]